MLISLNTIILSDAGLSACQRVPWNWSACLSWTLRFVNFLIQPQYKVLKHPGPWFVHEFENMALLCWSWHTTLIQTFRMKQISVPNINLLPTLLSSVRIIWWRQGLELLVRTISLMHTFCRWAWHFNQTCTSLKLTAVVNNQINLFCWDVSYRCQVWCLYIWWK